MPRPRRCLGRVQAIAIATGVTITGDREILGLAVGDGEIGVFWTAFLRSLRARLMSGVRLVISDAHEGLKGATAAVRLGAVCQRFRVDSLRNVLAHFPRDRADTVLAAHPHDLGPARRGRGTRPARCGRPDCRAALPGRGGDARLGQGAGHRLRRLPYGEGSMALLDRSGDDVKTKEVDRADIVRLAS